MKGTQTELALCYFDYLAECFPVMGKSTTQIKYQTHKKGA